MFAAWELFLYNESLFYSHCVGFTSSQTKHNFQHLQHPAHATSEEAGSAWPCSPDTSQNVIQPCTSAFFSFLISLAFILFIYFFFVQDDSTGLTHSVVGCRTWHPWPVQQCLLCDIVKCLIILLTYWVVFWVACGSAKMLSLKQKVWLVSLQSLGKISALSEGANCFAH